MAFEVETAKQLGLPVRCYDLNGNRISPETLSVDDRVDDAFMEAIKGARLI